MLRQTERRHLALILKLAAIYLLVHIANAAPNPAKDAPYWTIDKVQTNPKPVAVKETLGGTINSKNLTTTAVKGVTTAAPTVQIVTKHVEPLSHWSLSDKEIKGCPSGQILADDGTCRQPAG